MVEIIPEPEPAEREAILAALAADEDRARRASPWAAELLPRRGAEEDQP